MSRDPESLPERLRSADATGLERRLLDAASREQPSRETLERMARNLGIAAPAAGPLPEGSTEDGAAADRGASSEGGSGAAATAKAGAGSGVMLPVAAGTLVAVVVGVIFATRASTTEPARTASPAPVVQAQPPAEARVTPPTPSPAGAPLVEELSAAEATAPVPRSRPVASAGLSDQIALIDAARAAVSSGAGERALTLLRQYRDKYPAGSFRPEARVLQIEALMKLGRGAEARPLAERFVAEHRGSPLADRAARVAGLSPPSR